MTMYVKNTSARMITVNAGKFSTKIVPGSNESFKLSKEQAETAFVESLLSRGELVEVAAPKGEKQEEATDGLTKEELQEQLDALNVGYDKRSGVAKLQELLDEALAK